MEVGSKVIPVNFAIMLPSIALALYVMPHVVGVLYIAPFIILIALPVVKRLIPQPYSSNLYQLVAIVVLLIILLNILIASGNVPKNGFTSLFTIPLTLGTMITLSMALGIGAIFEGILSNSLPKVIGLLTFSLLPLLDQIFVLFLIHEYGYPYTTAYLDAYSQQLFSLIALVVTGSTNIFGTKYPPPLSRYAFPIDPVMLVVMIISLAAIMFYFVAIRETKLRNEVLSGVASALLVGAMLGFVVFYLIQITESSGFELFVASMAVIITLIYAGRSSPERKARKKGALKQKNDW